MKKRPLAIHERLAEVLRNELVFLLTVLMWRQHSRTRGEHQVLPFSECLPKPAAYRAVLSPCLSEGSLYLVGQALLHIKQWLKSSCSWLRSVPGLSRVHLVSQRRGGCPCWKAKGWSWDSLILSQDKEKVLQVGHHVWQCDSLYRLVRRSDIYPKSNIKRRTWELVFSPTIACEHPEGKCISASLQEGEGPEREYRNTLPNARHASFFSNIMNMTKCRAEALHSGAWPLINWWQSKLQGSGGGLYYALQTSEICSVLPLN